MLAVHDICVTVGDRRSLRHVLQGVTCSFEPGTLSVIAGPSGSGKTTLLSVMGCLLTPSSGRVMLNAVEANALTDAERSHFRLSNIGLIFQSFRLFSTLSVFENVELPLRLLRTPRSEARRRVRSALAEMDLLERFHDRVTVMSGGEQQRVAIARALVTHPSVILADEPTAALDGVSGRSIFERLQRLAVAGRTVVVVTHDQRMFAYGNRLITLEDGVLIGEKR